MTGKLLALFDDLLGADDKRAAGRHHGPGPAAAATGQKLVAVALQQADLVEGNAQQVDQDLGEGARMALTVIQRARDDRDAAIVIEPHAAHFLARRGCDFAEGTDAQAAQLAARFAFLAARRETGNIACIDSLFQRVQEVAAVDLFAVPRDKGHHAARHQVLSAQFYLVDA